MTTINQFINALTSLTISGVKTACAYPPASLNSADLPAQWAQEPSMSHDALTFQSYGGWPSFTARLIVAVVPVEQGTQAENWERVLDMMEAVDTALATASPGTVGKAKITWSTKAATVTLAGVDYWSTVTEINGHG